MVKKTKKATHIKYIKKRIKDIGYAVHPNFEEWLEAETDEKVWLHLHFLMALKLYERNEHFVRFWIMWHREEWDGWRNY